MNTLHLVSYLVNIFGVVFNLSDTLKKSKILTNFHNIKENFG